MPGFHCAAVFFHGAAHNGKPDAMPLALFAALASSGGAAGRACRIAHGQP